MKIRAVILAGGEGSRLAAAPALAQRLGDKQREVRVAAAVALAACGTRDSVEPLLRALTDEDPIVAQAAAVALENLTGHFQPFNPFAGEEEQHCQATAWREWCRQNPWEKLEEDLIARLSGNDRNDIRTAAVTLGHIGGDAARESLRAYVLRERERNPFPEWRRHNAGDEARFNSLADVNPRTLQAAVRSLGWLGDVDSTRKVADWQSAMTDVLRELHRVLKPGGHVALEVGEVHAGKTRLEEAILPCGLAAGLTPRLIVINDQKFTKTANCWGADNMAKGTNTNRIVLFQQA